MRTIAAPPRLFSVLFLFFFYFTLPLSGKSAAPETTQAYAEREQLWQSFRLQYPYHVQTIALSERRADGSMVLIVAEPPPHVDAAAIHSIFQAFGALFEERKHPVGYDGWVKDLVGVLVNATDDGALDAAILRLHRYCFFTDYKADIHYLERMPAVRSARQTLNLELKAVEYQQWFETDEQFFPVQGGPAAPLKTILEGAGAGIYFSRQPGFVAWVLPAGADIADRKADIRMFALDADLILGAVAGPGNVAILGRERVEDFSVLPPLRTESVLTLAAAFQYELGQSYERNAVFSGRYDKTHDWAPIYLDEALLHSEAGSLLNIADQLLKSWSCNGTVRYHNFETYPDPENWCFDRPILKELDAQSLTLNWNTQGASYALDGDNLEYYTLQRTGALPISYLPNENQPAQTVEESKVEAYQTKAYRCFAGWEDPHLARVVQYTALFQIFRRYQISADIRIPDAVHSSVPKDEVRRLLETIQTLDSAGMTRLSRQVGKKGIILKDFPPDREEAYWEARAKQARAELEPVADKVKKGLMDIRSRFGERGYAFLIGHIADRRHESGYLDGRLVLARFNSFSSDCYFLLRELADKAVIKDKLSASLENAAGPWIKTPSIVVSYATPAGDFDEEGTRISLVGGHNIRMNYTRFRTDPDLPPGKVRVDIDRNRRNIVYLNPQDLARLSPDVLRTANRRVGVEDLAQLGQEIENDIRKAEATPVRERSAVIPLTDRTAGRGYRPQNVRPVGATPGRAPIFDLQWELSRIACSDLVTAPKLEKLLSGLSTRQGDFDIFKSTGIIANPDQKGNALYVLSEDLARIGNLETVSGKIRNFLDLLPSSGQERWETDALLVQTIREGEAEILVLLYRIEGKYMGFISPLGRGAEIDEKYIKTALNKARDIFGARQVVWYGNEVRKADIYRIADESGVELLRRSPRVVTEIDPFLTYHHPLEAQVFEPEQAAAFNSIPATREELIQGGFSPENLSDWQNFKSEIDAQVEGKFRSITGTAAGFKQELIHGNSDVLLLVAHSDGVSVFVGNQRITVADIQSWEARQVKSNRPRIAILLSCHTGKMEQERDWLLFRTQRETLSETLLQKKYFDFILAPDHEIDPIETRTILSEILKGQSVRGLRALFKGWIGYVFTEPKRK